MDPLSLIVGVAIFVLGLLARRILFGRSANDLSRLICSCSHGYGTHSPKNGKCVGRVKRKLPGAWDWVDCRCQVYDGPVPPEEIVARFLPPGSGA